MEGNLMARRSFGESVSRLVLALGLLTIGAGTAYCKEALVQGVPYVVQRAHLD
jgi:hypothetical protein